MIDGRYGKVHCRIATDDRTIAINLRNQAVAVGNCHLSVGLSASIRGAFCVLIIYTFTPLNLNCKLMKISYKLFLVAGCIASAQLIVSLNGCSSPPKPEEKPAMTKEQMV